MQRERVRSGTGPGDRPGSLLEAFYGSVVSREEGTALAHRVGGVWEVISYRELYGQVRGVAGGLAQLGVRRGDMVALISANRVEWPVCDLAIQSLGAATVPVYPTLESAQFAHILRDCGAGVVIVEDAAMAAKVESVAGELPALEQVVVIEDGLEALRREESPAGWEAGWRSIHPDDVASVIYTSGTTGAPKGVVLSHGNFLANLEGIRRALPVYETDVFLSMLPLAHVFERTCGHYLALTSGAALYYAESIQKVGDDLREVAPTLALSVPRLYEKMYDRVRQRQREGSALRRSVFRRALEAGRERYELQREGEEPGRWLSWRLALYDRLVYRKVREGFGGRVRFFVSGGAKLNPDIGEYFHALGVRIVEGYGLTETSPVLACNRPRGIRFGTVGPPLENVEVRISDEGEVLARGPSITRGYLGDERATRESFTEDGWFRTGDLGEFDEAGYLRITERLKHIIVLSTGKNVAPAPVEAAMTGSPHISQAMVLGEGRKYVCALIVPDYEAVRDTLGLRVTDEELSTDGRVRRLIEREVAESTAGFAPYERPKRFALLSKELTQEAGELTPTLKVRAGMVARRYEALIEGMYSQEGGS